MYRVLFRIMRICIHIKEQLTLEVLLKKDSQCIVAKDSSPLINGIANVNITTEFLITKSQPSFELHVNFTFKKIKKQAGFIHINLHDWQQGGSYQQIRILQNAPGGKAIIQFGFVYFDSGIDELMRPLESLQMFQKYANQQYRCKIQKQNNLLAQNLKELNFEKEELTEFKDSFSKFNTQALRIQASLSSEMSSQIKKMDQSQFSLKQEQEKSLFLMELVRKSGLQNLINSVEGLNKDEMDSQENDSNAQ